MVEPEKFELPCILILESASFEFVGREPHITVKGKIAVLAKRDLYEPTFFATFPLSYELWRKIQEELGEQAGKRLREKDFQE